MTSQPPPPRSWFALSLAASLLFALLAVAIQRSGLLIALDFAIGDFFYKTPLWKIRGFDQLMELMSLLGEEGVILTAVIGSILLALRRSWGILALWVATIGGSIILNRLMKGQFQTVRSAVGHPEFVEVSTGFPSGHTMMALATYGLLAYLLSQRSHDRRQALLIFAASGLMIGLISLSRLYLLTHYLSDVLGGAAGGMAWLALCIGLFSLLSATRGTERRNGRRRPARA